MASSYVTETGLPPRRRRLRLRSLAAASASALRSTTVGDDEEEELPLESAAVGGGGGGRWTARWACQPRLETWERRREVARPLSWSGRLPTTNSKVADEEEDAAGGGGAMGGNNSDGGNRKQASLSGFDRTETTCSKQGVRPLGPWRLSATSDCEAAAAFALSVRRALDWTADVGGMEIGGWRCGMQRDERASRINEDDGTHPLFASHTARGVCANSFNPWWDTRSKGSRCRCGAVRAAGYGWVRGEKEEEEDVEEAIMGVRQRAGHSH